MVSSAIARAPLITDSRSRFIRRSSLGVPHGLPEYSEACLEGKRVLILGGTGRVGSSAAEALLTAAKGIKVEVASRSEESYKSSIARRPALSQTEFIRLDCTDKAALQVG